MAEIEQTPKSPFKSDPFLNKNVNEKEYGKEIKLKNTTGKIADIPEAVIPIEEVDVNNPDKTAENIFGDDDDDLPKNLKFAKSEKSGATNSKETKQKPVSKAEGFKLNSDEDFTSPKAKKKGAEAFAGMILSAYSFVMQMTSKYLMMDEQSVIDIAVKEGLPLDILKFPIDIGDGEQMTFTEYIDDYNEGIETAFDCEDEEWKEEMMENLTAICLEKGLALTPMQTLIFKGLEKPVKGVISAIVGKTRMKSMMQSMGQMLKEYAKQQGGGGVIDSVAPIVVQAQNNATTNADEIKEQLEVEFHSATVIEPAVTSPNDKRSKKIQDAELVQEGHEPEEIEFAQQQREVE